MCCTPSRNNKRHLPRHATSLSVWPRWPSRAKAGKTASALRTSDLRSTDSTCSSSSATWNDVRFELIERESGRATRKKLRQRRSAYAFARRFATSVGHHRTLLQV